MRQTLLVTLLALLLVATVATAAVLSDSSEPVGPTPVDLADHLDVLFDASGNLSLEDILATSRQAEFQSLAGHKPSFGFSNQVVWLRWQLANRRSTDLIRQLEVAYPMLDDLRLYDQYQGNWRQRQAGDMLPFYQREQSYRHHLFALTIAPHSEQTFYLRVASSSSLNIPLLLWQPEALNRHIQHEQMLLGICFGAIMMMVLYNFFLLIALRVETYLHYVFFISASGLFLFTLNGLSFQYLWPQWIWWANHCLPILIFLCNISCISFLRSFLETPQEMATVDKALLGYMTGNGLLLLLSPLLSYSLAIRLATSLSLLAALLSLLLALRLSLRLRQARFYLAAWLPLLLGIIMYALKSFGLFAGQFANEYAMNYGLLMMMTLLSLGVADRINSIKRERLEVQRQAYEHQKRLTIAFERFVPKRFLSLLGKESIVEVQLGDHVEREMSVLFADIRFFTALSEQMSPRENFQFLNSYLQRIEPVVEDHNGIIDKYIGDAIMALFEDSDDAVAAAIAMLAELEEYNLGRARAGYLPIRLGIGINHGSLMLGTIGSSGRMEGTVISDAVNLASRIEGLTKEQQASLLISDQCRKNLRHGDDYRLRKISDVKVRGKRDLITIWEVLARQQRAAA